MSRLTRIIPFAHDLLTEVLSPGATAVDLTAGNGHDTLFLAESVGPDGTILGFDVQDAALDATASRLKQRGIVADICGEPPDVWPAGVHLLQAGHQRLGEFIAQPLDAAIANLGYLPGSDRQVITRPETTLAALDQATNLLRVGGRLAVVVYRGHAGGAEESDVVLSWFRGLEPNGWDLLEVYNGNRPAAPFLLVAERR